MLFSNCNFIFKFPNTTLIERYASIYQVIAEPFPSMYTETLNRFMVIMMTSFLFKAFLPCQSQLNMLEDIKAKEVVLAAITNFTIEQFRLSHCPYVNVKFIL